MTKDKELYEEELKLKDMEKLEKESFKKKELEGMLK